MKSMIETDNYNITVDGSTIRVTSNKAFSNKSIDKGRYAVGIVSILPKVQIAIGEKLESFLEALEFSRLPLALKKTVAKGAYSTYDVVRLETGNIKEATIATLSVYNKIIIGITYSRSILLDREFRKLVKLSAMHQLAICNKEDPCKLLKATSCISTLTGIPRDKLVTVQTARSIKVKVQFKNKYNLPMYYTFALDKTNKYNLLQISFDYNDIAKELNKHVE